MNLRIIAGFGLLSLALTSCTAVVPAGPARSGTASWMEPDAKSASRLLYVSDIATFDVYVYQFPSLRLTGKLHGFADPQGVCADASGNVWIADTQFAQVVEYAHGGTKPIATVADPVGYPVGCAVDAGSGDLAVTNLYGFSGPGSVIVYKGARGTPKVYSNAKIYSYYFAGYDGHGNLYVSGATTSGGYLLGVLSHGSRSIALVKIDGGKLYFPGTVAWVGATLALGDQRCHGQMSSCFYELHVAGRSARVTATTPLHGSCDVVEASVDATHIAGGDDAAYCRNGRSTVDIWPYPAGGNPSASVHGPRVPVGAALSVGHGS